jgi:hypothetical protein
MSNTAVEPDGTWNTPFRSLFRRIVLNAEQTNSAYPNILCKGAQHVIPFFGDVERAVILTVGINPSGEEFKMGRCWGINKDDPAYLLYLLGRLKNYFSLKIDAHNFFEVWEAGLNQLGHSYRRDAAHVDISPRALISLQKIDKFGRRDSSGQKPHRQQYLQCKAELKQALASDVGWLFDLFSLLPRLKCILMAGNLIISPPFLDRWIETNLPVGWKLSFLPHPATDRKTSPKRSFGTLQTPAGMRFGIFWCSVSPSGDAFGNTADALVSTIASNLPLFQSLGCAAPMLTPPS